MAFIPLKIEILNHKQLKNINAILAEIHFQ